MLIAAIRALQRDDTVALYLRVTAELHRFIRIVRFVVARSFCEVCFLALSGAVRRCTLYRGFRAGAAVASSPRQLLTSGTAAAVSQRC